MIDTVMPAVRARSTRSVCVVALVHRHSATGVNDTHKRRGQRHSDTAKRVQKEGYRCNLPKNDLLHLNASTRARRCPSGTSPSPAHSYSCLSVPAARKAVENRLLPPQQQGTKQNRLHLYACCAGVTKMGL